MSVANYLNDEKEMSLGAASGSMNFAGKRLASQGQFTAAGVAVVNVTDQHWNGSSVVSVSLVLGGTAPHPADGYGQAYQTGGVGGTNVEFRSVADDNGVYAYTIWNDA
tara:strand:- start:1628 stop:1951 length:324 start_codon:yes stop_codon:yes gene_type:complete